MIDVKFVITMLRLGSFIRRNHLTAKGLLLSHHLMKNVVENLPFPLQNPAVISDYEVYKKYLAEILVRKENPKKKSEVHTSISI